MGLLHCVFYSLPPAAFSKAPASTNNSNAHAWPLFNQDATWLCLWKERHSCSMWAFVGRALVGTT